MTMLWLSGLYACIIPQDSNCSHPSHLGDIMRHSLVGAVLSLGAVLLGGLALGEQTPAKPEGEKQEVSSVVNGPSMEQTVAFINEKYQQQGQLRLDQGGFGWGTHYDQSVTLEGSCDLVVSESYSLEKTYLGQPDGSRSTQVSVLHLDRSQPTSVSVETNTFLPPVHFEVSVGKSSTAYRVAATTSEAEPRSFRGGANQGVISSLSSDSFTFKSITGALYVVHPTEGVTFRRHPDTGGLASEDDPPAQFHEFRVGDHISTNYKVVTLVEPSARFLLPAFKDKEDALRVAKALIHAMVLCHKDAKPSLF